MKMKITKMLVRTLALIYFGCMSLPINAQTTNEPFPAPPVPPPLPTAPAARLFSDAQPDVGLQQSNRSNGATASSSIASDGSLRNEEELVLMSGPVHEAFAQQQSVEPTSGLLVAAEPPPMIDEIPPESRPLGNSIIWIPGYWGWDEQSKDFVWVTGLWRQAPPNRRWVPGYWNLVDNGYQWISGFWADEQREEIAYLPPPPPPIDAQPSIPAPGDNYIYIPGQWTYTDQQYQWRAGFWTPSISNWVWVADSYVWTPRGCIYRSGYWDYELAERGTLFCPMQFGYAHAGLRYQPRYVLNTGVNWLANLFVYPAYRHYYFGNYYGQQYSQLNILPWIVYGQSNRYNDPFYSHYYAGNRQSLRHIDDVYQRNENDRRQDWPRSFADLNQFTSQRGDQSAAFIVQAAAIGALLSNDPGMRRQGWDTKFNFGKVEKDFTNRTLEGRNAFRELAQQRTSFEPKAQLDGNAKGNANAQGNPNTQAIADALRRPNAQDNVARKERNQQQGPRGNAMASDVLRLPKTVQNPTGSTVDRNSVRTQELNRGKSTQPLNMQSFKPNTQANTQGQASQPRGNQPNGNQSIPGNRPNNAPSTFPFQSPLNPNLNPNVNPNVNPNPNSRQNPGSRNVSPNSTLEAGKGGNPGLIPGGLGVPNVQPNPAPNPVPSGLRPNINPGRNAIPEGQNNPGKPDKAQGKPDKAQGKPDKAQGNPDKTQGDQGKGRGNKGEGGKQK